MQIRVGYVAISLTIGLSASKTMTYKNYQMLGKEDGNKKLDYLMHINLKILKEILKYNYTNNIHFYRISSALVPLSTHSKVNFDYIHAYKKEWEEIGILIRKYQMRVDMHLPEFCVLNSNKEKVLENSINILSYHYQLFNAMKIKGKLVLHVGGAYNSKKDAVKRFKDNFKKLEPNIQKMIILENDDKIFNIKDVLEICEELKIPMVLDYHHYLCNNEGEDISEYLPRIINTWKGIDIPKMHFSSPKSVKEKRCHADYINADDFINFINLLKPFNQSVDIMLECKAKDMALFKLIRELKYKTNYKFIDDTTFFI